MATQLHHYIPQFYLRNFRSRQNKNQHYIYVYEKGREVYEVNIAYIAGERGLYTAQEKDTGKDTDMIEDLFTEAENLAAPNISSIINTSSVAISGQNKADLDFFFALLYVRNH